MPRRPHDRPKEPTCFEEFHANTQQRQWELYKLLRDERDMLLAKLEFQFALEDTTRVRDDANQ